ncbi:hypothetical protein [Planomicrobium sp. CPCC 101110]|nr:hypothetical protein [Planomicrobium sp. CPCC 101110]
MAIVETGLKFAQGWVQKSRLGGKTGEKLMKWRIGHLNARLQKGLDR